MIRARVGRPTSAPAAIARGECADHSRCSCNAARRVVRCESSSGHSLLRSSRLEPPQSQNPRTIASRSHPSSLAGDTSRENTIQFRITTWDRTFEVPAAEQTAHPKRSAQGAGYPLKSLLPDDSERRCQLTGTCPKEKDVARGRTQRAATVGVAEHANSAVLVTVAPGGKFLDRRRIELTDRGLPTHPPHHEGSWAVGRYRSIPGARALSLAEAVALVERVRASAARGAREGLEALAAAVPVPIASIAIRACPKLPPTTEERIADNRAQTLADSVMYREVLATAAEARGWSVQWYDREHVFRDAASALSRDVDAFLYAMGRSVGPPWQAKHKLAAAAALAAIGRCVPRQTVG